MPERDEFPDRVLDLRFGGRRITVDALLEASSRLLAILRLVDARATDRPGGTLDWVIRDLRAGSAVLELVAEPRDERTPVWAPETVVRRFKRGMRQVAATGERPDAFPEEAMRRLYELTAVLDGNGIDRIEIGDAAGGIAFAPGMRRAVREALEGRYRAIGSVEGRIDGISAHAPPYTCTLYTTGSGEAIRCSFEPPLLPEIHRLFRARVSARGVFRTRPDGEVTRFRIEAIEPLPDAEALPTVDDILGILTDGA